jgi:MFS family permease
MAMTRKVGKRPVYLVSILFLCVTNIWSYFAKSYGNLLASRVVGGFLTAASDAPVPSVATDLFYFHERGHALMIFNVAISAGAFFGPFINAYITQYLGWAWMCGVMAIVSGVTFIVAITLIKETAYIIPTGVRDLERSAETYESKRSWASSMSLTRGFDPEASFFRWVFETVQLMAYPPIWVSGLTVGVFIGW